MLRYKLLVFILFQVLFLHLQAQVTVQLGTGTNETGGDTELTPFGSYYEDQRTQYILLASELSSLGLQSGNISSIAFDVTSASTQTLNSFKVKMKSTVNSSYSITQDFESMSSSTLCYSGTYVTTANQWNSILFSNSFYWNGSSNIVLEITFDNSSYTEDSEVMYTTTTDEMTWGMASDSYFSDVENMWEDGWGISARPNMKISGAGTAPTYFESWNTGATGDDINWTILSGATGSRGTGPSSAYEGSDYVYVEASSPNYPSKKAYLTSPSFNLSSYGSAEINFAYHMYGAAMGSLTLEASTNGSTWASLWSKSGDQGNQWHQGTASLDSYAGGAVYLRFTGITGSTYTSDMALDQLVVSGGAALGNASPSSAQNYIYTVTPQDKDATDFIEAISYFDGLGRPKQNVSYAASPNSKDIVQPIAYDDYGREAVKYLPYEAYLVTNGAYQGNALNDTYASSEHYKFYNTYSNSVVNDTKPYAETVLEASPLNRPLAQGAPGYNWQPTYSGTTPTFLGHTAKYEYGTNAGSNVLSFDVVNDALVKTGYYAANELYKTTVKDENWSSGNLGTTEEYKDKLGRVVLKRSYVVDGTTKAVETYYAYDDFGLLRYVLSPEASALVPKNTTQYTYTNTHSTVIKPYSYYYQYDDRKRMIVKQLPGAEQVYMVYDARDRLVATQDGEQRNNDHWLFTKYDAFNRPILTGILVNSSSRASMQDAAYDFYEIPPVTPPHYEDKTTDVIYDYTNNSFPKTPTESHYLSVTYYDDYSFTDVQAFDSGKSISDYSDSDGNVNYLDEPKGQVTGNRVKILDGNELNNSTEWLISTHYYDNKYRVVQSINDLYPRSVVNKEWISNNYDFTGRVLQTNVDQIFQTNVGFDNQWQSKLVAMTNSYDHVGRLTGITHKIGTGSTVQLVSMTYNELGELTNKVFHSNKQYVDYAYNIRGWLTSINNPDVATSTTRQFAMKLHYNTKPSNLTADSQYNGNISSIEWRVGASSGKRQGYGYKYDALNRLINADFGEGSTSGTNILTDKADYDVAISEYDLNGNIEALSRKTIGGSTMDNLTYYYSGSNQLQAVVENGNDNLGFIEKSYTTSGEYTYDNNGNLTADSNRGLTDVQYNYLNLPQKVIAGSSDIDYIYTADGQKRAKISPTGDTDYYAGGFVYKKDNGTSTYYLDYIQHPEGVVQYTGSSSEYQYYLKDHLGNNRVVVDQNSIREQQQSYYPFGMFFEKSGGNNTYLYNGKELQEDALAGNPLDWYDYGARFYDPSLGRFHTQDRYADEFSSWSPYHYASNNPISYIDINGDSTYTFNIATSALQMVSDVGGNEQQIVNFVNKDGSALIVNDKAVSSIIDGEGVYVTPTSKGTLVSSYDPFAGLSDDYNSNSGYEYTAADLKTRHKLKGTSLEYGVAAREAGGNAGPIAGKTAYDAYVKKWGTDKAFMYGIEGGYFSNMLPGGSGDVLSGSQRALSSGSKSIRSFSPNFSNIKSIKKIQPRAPKGGITINGKFYKGGQFIPR